MTIIYLMRCGNFYISITNSMKGSRLYIDLFKVFRDVAETRNFSKAAERNYITQSAVSQQVAFLERYFDKQLIIRGKGKFSLTQEGRIFLKGCENILQAYQETMDILQDNLGEVAQTVNIESVYSIGFYHLPPLIKSFMKKYKKINLHIEYNRSDRIYTDVIQGVCDFGIIAYPWQHPMVDIQYGEREELIFVCNPDNKLSKAKKIRLKNLNNIDFISFIKEIPTRNAVDAILKNHGVSVHVVHEFDNVETLKRSVELGQGVSLLPKNAIQQEVKKETLVSIEITEGPFYRDIGIITRKERPLSKATQEAILWMTGKG